MAAIVLVQTTNSEVVAKRKTVPSPDGRYIAIINSDASGIAHLDVKAAARLANSPLVSEIDVSGVIWDPAEPHRVIYAESGAYGTGKVAIWNGRKEQVLWRCAALVEDLRLDRIRHRLSFTVRIEKDSPPSIDREFGRAHSSVHSTPMTTRCDASFASVSETNLADPRNQPSSKLI